jgi:DNA repair protein RadC
MKVYEVKVRTRKVSNDEYIINSPSSIASLVREIEDGEQKEYFMVVYLNTKNRMILNVVSVGTMTEALVHPREVFRTAVLHGATSIIVAHTHPSGQCQPSAEDIATTKRLVEAGKILGIAVVDHVVVGDIDHGYASLKEMGVIL